MQDMVRLREVIKKKSARVTLLVLKTLSLYAASTCKVSSQNSIKAHEIHPRQDFQTKGDNSRTKSARVTLIVRNTLSLYAEPTSGNL